jgi:hypothetical protein
VHFVLIAGDRKVASLTLQIDRSVVSGHGYNVRLGLRTRDSNRDEPA